MTAVPTQVIFKGMTHSYALEYRIREHVEWLRQFERDILSCRVLVEVPHRHQLERRPFRVQLSISVPGGAPIVVDRTPPDGATGEEPYQDAYQVVRDAFDVARRRLQDYMRTQRGFVKAHSR